MKSKFLNWFVPNFLYSDEYFIGKPYVDEKLRRKFQPRDGSINLYYGRIGGGKTYAATADILSALQAGQVVYANWHINFDEYDQRRTFFFPFVGLFGLKKVYMRFPKENLHYFHPDDVSVDFLSRLSDCTIYLDEGQWIFDSYEGTKFSKEKRKLILHTRHHFRNLNIITQRPTAIQVSARGNVNRFYKCECLWKIGFKLFRRTEFQDMLDETVDETQPISTQYYIGSRRVFNAYNSYYMREGMLSSQKLYVGAWILNYSERLYLSIKNLFDSVAALMLPRKKSPDFNPIILQSAIEKKLSTVEPLDSLSRELFGIRMEESKSSEVLRD